MIILLFKTRDLSSLATYRHQDDWEVAFTEEDTCFVRLPISESVEQIIQSLPCLKSWSLQENSQLIPTGKTLPEEILPPLSWLPLHTLLPAVPVSPKENEPFFGHLSFSLLADTEIREPSGLILAFSHFKRWVETAPAVRLSPLRFALSEQGQVIILGQPLPPLNGLSLYLKDQILLPSGSTLPKYILPEDLANTPNEILYIENDGTFHRISNELFVDVSRAAVRLTSRSLI